MIAGYQKPAEMPMMTVDDDGIIHTNYGTIMVTAAHIVHVAARYRELSGMDKSLVIHTSEAGRDPGGDLAEISRSDWVKERVEAVAIVVDRKIARVLVDIYMKFQKNPYPTKVFPTIETAKEWLRAFL